MLPESGAGTVQSTAVAGGKEIDPCRGVVYIVDLSIEELASWMVVSSSGLGIA